MDLSVDETHEVSRVSVSYNLDPVDGLSDLSKIGLGQDNVGSTHVLLDTSRSLGSRDGDDEGGLSEQPGESELPRAAPLDFGNGLHLLYQGHVRSERLGCKSGVPRAEVSLSEILHLQGSSQHTAPQRRVRDQSDAQLLAAVEDSVSLDVGGESRVLCLQCIDLDDLGSATDGVCRGLGETDEANLGRQQ